MKGPGPDGSARRVPPCVTDMIRITGLDRYGSAFADGQGSCPQAAGDDEVPRSCRSPQLARDHTTNDWRVQITLACERARPRCRRASPRRRHRETGTSAGHAPPRRTRPCAHRIGVSPPRTKRSTQRGCSRRPDVGRGRLVGTPSVVRRSGSGSARPRSDWFRIGAVPCPARRVDPRYFSTSALISAWGTGGPAGRGSGRPSFVWTIRARTPPGSSMS